MVRMMRGKISGRKWATLAVVAVGGLVAVSAAAVPAASGRSSTAAAGPGVAQAQAIVSAAEKRPTSVGLTKAIKKPIPKGKKIFFISCGAEACTLQGDIIKQGASDLGWKATTINTDGSPQQEQAAFDQALRQGADGIILNAVTTEALAKQIAEAKAKKVPFVTCCSLAQMGSDVLYNTSTSPQNVPIGKYLAAYAVADSGGRANVLYVDISIFQILTTLASSFKDELSSLCPSCGYASIDTPLSALGTPTVTTNIVSYLRAHPSTNYVVLSVQSALAAGLPAALDAAGLSNVKIIGQGPGPADFAAFKSGDQAAGVPFDYYTIDYLMLDSFARHWTGLPIPQTAPPHWLATGLNTTPELTQKVAPIVVNYRNLFLKLWGKKK
jgi:ABC-type sugar transport system substrate-binding protein